MLAVHSGVVLGSLLALSASRWAATLLFQKSPWDPAVYATIGASRVDPNVALRAE